MSQSKVNVELSIKTTITLDDAGEPQAVSVENTGNIPRGAVRAIGQEALEAHFGLVDHGYRVQMSPELEEEDVTVFEVYRSIIGTRK